MLDVFFVQSTMDRCGVVATKAISQTLGHFTKILYFGGVATMGAMSSNTATGLSLPKIVACVVLAFTGTTFSRRVLEKMSDANFRLWTKWTVLVIGAIYLASGLWLIAGIGGS